MLHSRMVAPCRFGAAQVGVLEVGAGQIAHMQIGAPQVGVAEVRPAEIQVVQVAPDEVRALQLGVLEGQTRRVFHRPPFVPPNHVGSQPFQLTPRGHPSPEVHRSTPVELRHQSPDISGARINSRYPLHRPARPHAGEPPAGDARYRRSVLVETLCGRARPGRADLYKCHPDGFSRRDEAEPG